MKGNKLTNLSVEQIVDCNGFQDPNSEEACCGVFGGWPNLVFEYVNKTVRNSKFSFPKQLVQQSLAIMNREESRVKMTTAIALVSTKLAFHVDHQATMTHDADQTFLIAT